MDGYFSDFQRLLKNGLTSDSFAAHYGQHLKSTTSRTDLCKCMMLKVVNNINSIVEIKSFMRANWNLCMDECLTVLKKLSDKHGTLINNILEIYRSFCKKKIGQFPPSTAYPGNRWKG